MATLTYRCEGAGGPLNPKLECKWVPRWEGACQRVRGTIRAKFVRTDWPVCSVDGVLEYFVRGESKGRWLLPCGQEVYMDLPLTCNDLNIDHKISVSGAVPSLYTWTATVDVYIDITEAPGPTPTPTPRPTPTPTPPPPPPPDYTPLLVAFVIAAFAGALAVVLLTKKW
jgi:hypothetical protein